MTMVAGVEGSVAVHYEGGKKRNIDIVVGGVVGNRREP